MKNFYKKQAKKRRWEIIIFFFSVWIFFYKVLTIIYDSIRYPWFKCNVILNVMWCNLCNVMSKVVAKTIQRYSIFIRTLFRFRFKLKGRALGFHIKFYKQKLLCSVLVFGYFVVDFSNSGISTTENFVHDQL